MCNFCRYNSSMLLAAIISGATEPVTFLQAEDDKEPVRVVDPTPLRIGLAAVLSALGPPVKKADAAAAKATALPKVEAAFAPLSAEQIAYIGLMLRDVTPALEAVSALGIMELQRRRDAGDESAAAELEDSTANESSFIAVILGGRAPSAAEPDFRH